MKQCPFCGTEWEGKGPCPGCGIGSETPRDDTMFRPPENGAGASQEAPPEFDVEKLLRWEPASEEPQEEPETQEAGEVEEADILEEVEEEEDSRPLKKSLKRWQKFTMAAVAVVVTAAMVVRMWPQTPPLPPEPAFFVQEGSLMALPMDGKPQQLGTYTDGMESYAESYPAVSQDHQQTAWVEDGALQVLSAEGKVTPFSQNSLYQPRFSQDGRFVYGMVPEEGNTCLYQMNPATGEEKKVGPMGGYSDSYWENDSFVVVYEDNNQFAIYDSNTLKKITAIEFEGTVLALSGNRIYYIENMAESDSGMQLCCWQDGESKVLLEHITEYDEHTDGTAYLECLPENTEPIPVMDLFQNDMEDSDPVFLEELEGETILPPHRLLYYFDHGNLTRMGECQLYRTIITSSGLETPSFVVRSPGYCPVEEAKGTISLKGLYEMRGDTPDASLLAYIWNQWPKEDNVFFAAEKEKLFSLPLDVQQISGKIEIDGGYVALCLRQGDPVVWLGKKQGNAMTEEAQYFLSTSGLTDFMVTEQGDIYYWEGDYTATLYANGVELSNHVAPGSIQCTEDGAVYFLEGAYSQNLTLCRVYEGKKEELAQSVGSFVAYSRDYAVCLQNRMDQNCDLLVCKWGEEPKLAAQNVEKLLIPSWALSDTQGRQ